MNDKNIQTNNSKTPVIVSSLIKAERTRRNLSQRKFATVLTVSGASVDKWENNEREPDEQTLFRVSREAKEIWARKLALSCLRLRYPDFQITRKEKTPLPVTPLDELEPA